MRLALSLLLQREVTTETYGFNLFLYLSFIINEYVCDFIELNKFLGDAKSECLKMCLFLKIEIKGKSG